MSTLAPSTLSVDAGGRVLDRLAALEAVFPPECRRAALAQAGRVSQRSCALTHEVVLGLVLAMGVFAELPIRGVFQQSRRFRRDQPVPPRSTLCMARARLGAGPLRHLFAATVRPLAKPGVPGEFYRGLRTVSVDGTIYNVPDSDANAIFGRPQSSRGPGAFPQVRKVSLVETRTHVEFAFAYAGIDAEGSAESVLAKGLFAEHLGPDMLMLWDRGFVGFGMWRSATRTGAQVLGRAKSNQKFQPSRRLADGSYLSKLDANSAARRAKTGGVRVRVIEYALDAPGGVGHGEKHVLLTTLLDADEHPAETLIELYHERWEHELVLDEQKTHQSPWGVNKSGDLRSETPAGVEQELYALSLAHFAVRPLMVRAAEAVGGVAIDPDRLSFVGCLRAPKCRLPECPAAPELFAEWLGNLLAEMGQERTEARRNRVNPRVVKVKMSKYKKKRPEHRKPRRPAKPFRQTIVMSR